MASNTFRKMRRAALSVTMGQAKDTIGPNLASYGITSNSMWSAFTGALTAYNNSVTDAEAAKQLFHSKVNAQEEKRQKLFDAIVPILNVIYANPNVTDEMIINAGFAPRDKVRTPAQPHKPLDLLAKPSADGQVALSWKRNGNVQSISFQVEAKGEGDENWTPVFITTKTKAKLLGYAPGVTCWFRVVAIKEGMKSLPSNEVAIYHDAPSVELELAA
jgi:hypothetical protein